MPDSVCSRCRMDRERFEPSGRECPRSGAQTSAWPYGGGDGQRGSAGGALSFWETCASRPPGRVLLSCLRAGAGDRCGPVADMARLSRQSPCRNTRPKHLSRSVQTAAGVTRAEGPEEGQVDKPTPCRARLTPVGWGRHPASSGPRAVSATQCMSRSNGFI